MIESLGWTLIHFLWQASLIAALLWIALRLIRPAGARYLLSAGALLAMLACAATTTVLVWQPPVAPDQPVAPQEPVSTTEDSTTALAEPEPAVNSAS